MNTIFRIFNRTLREKLRTLYYGNQKKHWSVYSFCYFCYTLQCKNREEDDIRLITIQGSNIQRFLDYDALFSKLDSLGHVNLITRNGDWMSAENFYISVRKNLQIL